MNGPLPAQHSRPLWLAALITAFVTPAAFLLAILAVNLVRGEPTGELVFRGMGFVVLFGLPVSLGAAYLVGLPLVLLLRSQHLLTPMYIISGAALVGATTLSVLTITVMRTPLTPVAVALGVGLGAIAGVVFCVAAGIPFRSRVTRAAA